MDENVESKGGHSWAMWAAVVLVAYPLSIGPFLALYARLGAPDWMGKLGIVYAPLEVLEDVPGLGPALEAYARFWYEDVGGGMVP